jgi:aminoglycoside phosphotransferase
VPIPEVFGWTEDGGQRFIYMSLIEGKTLQERWYDMNEDEKRAICEQLKPLVKAYGFGARHMTATSVSSFGCKQT